MNQTVSENIKTNAVFVPVKIYLKRNIGIIVGLAVIMAITSTMSDNFLTGSNLLNILRQISTNAFLAFGMTFVILIGGIDLSVGPVVAFSGVFVAYSMANWGWSAATAVLAAVVLCILIGAFNGTIVTATNIAPFVVTLSTQTIIRGAAMLLGNGCPIRVTNEQFCKIGTSYLGPIAYPVFYMLIVMVICYILLNKTKFGRRIYALGGNRMAAKFAGIRVSRVEIMVYILSAVLAGLAGIVLGARLSAGVPATGEGYECDAIAAVVLGGASFAGGVGTIGGTLIGAIIIGVLNNGLNMLNVASFWQYVAKGIVILAAVLLDYMRKNNSLKKRLRSR